MAEFSGKEFQQIIAAIVASGVAANTPGQAVANYRSVFGQLHKEGLDATPG